MTVQKLYPLTFAANAFIGNADPALIRATLSDAKQKTWQGKGSQARGKLLEHSATKYKTRLP